jgi:carbamoyltransferase
MHKKHLYVLGISCYFHDSAAVLLKDGQLVAAAHEERFTRIKHDERFPIQAVHYCLKEAGIDVAELDHVVYYEKPVLKFARILEMHIRTWPKGLMLFLKAIPVWMKKKLWIKQLIQRELGFDGEILFSEHHISHAASSYYSSPFNEATVVTIDGVGEWETTTIGYGKGGDLVITESIHFPDSLGLFYSAFTYYLGFKVNSAEYKVMGLAPYGNAAIYESRMRQLIKIHKDGSYTLDQRYFSYAHGLVMTNKKFHNLFGGRPRDPETPLTQREKDIAASLQKILEEAVLVIIEHAYQLHPSENLCLAGGVALNCVANEKIVKQSKFKNVFIQPASGDAGGALGCALFIQHAVLKQPRVFEMKHAYWGPEYSGTEIRCVLDEYGVKYRQYEPEQTIQETAKLIVQDHIVGWFQGRMEFGPRALGNRSILADARKKENWQRVNLKIKFRESFRPFAPTVLEDKSSIYFDNTCPSPYMLLTAQSKTTEIPAVTHVDGSARLQTINRDQNQRYYDLINAFRAMTGCAVVINTSFNVRGEPIVCSPKDALLCFLHTDIDDLILGNYHVTKIENQHLFNVSDQEKYLKTFSLD